MKKPLKPPDPKIHNPEHVFAQAYRFKAADEMLRDGRDKAYIAAIPSLVMSSFACELLLKCIHLLDGSAYRDIHHLGKLYRQLRNTRKQSIEIKWNQSIAISAINNLSKTIGGVPLPTDLPTLLKDGGEAFEILRYFYEPHKNKQGMMCPFFVNVLLEEIFTIKPEWDGAMISGDPTAPLQIQPTWPFR